jgi:hypothetical protein
MKTAELWVALEKTAGSRSGWWLRLACPSVVCPLFVAMEGESRRRAVLLRLPEKKVIPPRRSWPRCRGLDAIAMEVEGAPHFGVVLKEPRFADVFTALAEDLVRRVAEAATPAAQAEAFLGQLARWQKFLAASLDGLGEEAQRGLWGELAVLRDLLLPTLGAAAVAGWKGPSKAHQDFQFGSGALEVKTTLAKQPQVVRIASERQLDPAGWTALFLAVLALDVREGGAESLPKLVADGRAAVAGDMTAREQLEDALLAAGYLDVHADRYAGRGYVVRSRRCFRVKRGFPAIVERDLARGVGDVVYGLAVEACEPFAVASPVVVETLSKSASA